MSVTDQFHDFIVRMVFLFDVCFLSINRSGMVAVYFVLKFCSIVVFASMFSVAIRFGVMRFV